MKKALILLLICTGTVWATDEPAETACGEAAQSAIAASIVRVDETITFYCDIPEFPPLFGQDMPVRLKMLRPARTAEENQKLLAFLNELLFSKTRPVQSVRLKDAERGTTFCLLADVEVDGRDLCDLLVERNLAHKIVVVGDSAAAESDNAPAAGEPDAEPAGGYVCSKSSKVFHKPTCSHAKRLDMSKAQTFATRDEAIKTGRRPCKTCNP
jgi:hypothetical protein